MEQDGVSSAVDDLASGSVEELDHGTGRATEQPPGRLSQFVLPGVAIVADVSAVVGLQSGSPDAIILVIGIAAFLVGGTQLVARRGKPLDRTAALAVTAVIFSAAVFAIAIDRSVRVASTPTVQASPATIAPETLRSGTGQASGQVSASPPVPTAKAGDSGSSTVLRSESEPVYKDLRLVVSGNKDIDVDPPVTLERNGDLYYNNVFGWVSAGDGASIARLDGVDVPTLAQCSDAAQAAGVSDVGLIPEIGDWFCVRTESGRVMAWKITKVDAVLEGEATIWHLE